MTGVDVRVGHVLEDPDAVACAGCGRSGDIFIKGKAGALCLDCVGLGHLEFLPAGYAALTRRTVKASRQPVIVMRIVRAARRGMPLIRRDRQGTLAEPAAIEQAARESLSDVEAPGRDEIFATIREHFPGCPAERAEAIALHTAVRFGGRGSRRIGAREVDFDAVRRAVEASALHVDTDYNTQLAAGVDRETARAQVDSHVRRVLRAWRDGVTALDA